MVASTGKRNPWRGGTLGEAAAKPYEPRPSCPRYEGIVRRRDKSRTPVAVNSILTIAVHPLSDPAAHFIDLGA